jgi:hypothetical protein
MVMIVMSVYLVTKANVNPHCKEDVATVCTLVRIASVHLSCMFCVYHLQ